MENYIENKAAQAESLFKSGYNCAQSVALAFSDYVAEKTGLDEDSVRSILTNSCAGFGGGFGRMRDICGCVSGMTAIAGFICPAAQANDASGKAQKAENYALVQKLAGKFKDEIVPVEIPQKKGDPIIFDTDEFPKFGTTIDKVAKLKPAFKKDGIVTAANASGINDAGAAVVVMSKEKADELGIKPLCTIKSYASAGVDPSIMGVGPIPASQKALAKAGLTIEDIDLVEANEAFAAQSLAVRKDLKLDPEKTNVNGGAIAIGHPIGASGCRILITLIYEMMKRDSKYGLATLCIGGGMGTALIVER